MLYTISPVTLYTIKAGKRYTIKVFSPFFCSSAVANADSVSAHSAGSIQSVLCSGRIYQNGRSSFFSPLFSPPVAALFCGCGLLFACASFAPCEGCFWPSMRSNLYIRNSL